MNQSAPQPLPTDTDAHLVARRFRMGVRILLAMSLTATLVCLLFSHPAAYLAAIPIPVLLGILVVTDIVELRSRAGNFRKPGQRTISREDVGVVVETIGFITVLKIVGVLAIGTFIIAAAFFDWAVVGVVATAGFLLAVLINLPFMPLYFSESERDELDKLKRERRDSRVRQTTEAP